MCHHVDSRAIITNLCRFGENARRAEWKLKFNTPHCLFADKEDSSHTIGVEFGSKIVNVGGSVVKLQIWDTAGECVCGFASCNEAILINHLFFHFVANFDGCRSHAIFVQDKTVSDQVQLISK